jgi:hypothetical protein
MTIKANKSALRVVVTTLQDFNKESDREVTSELAPNRSPMDRNSNSAALYHPPISAIPLQIHNRQRGSERIEFDPSVQLGYNAEPTSQSPPISDPQSAPID